MNKPIVLTIITGFLILFGLGYYGEAEDGTCYESNVEKVYLRGEMFTYDSCDPEEEVCSDSSSELVLDSLDEASQDENIKAIWLEVDSTGGEPQAAEEIYQKIKLIEKPVIASIRADGTSSAYWAASSADYIFALNTSNIGSIGITMSYTDNAKKNEKEGITHNELNTGKYKGVGDENKALTGSDKSFILSFIGNIYETFIGDVASGRSLDVDVIRELADGRFWTGKQALELKLIDQIGTEDDVVDYIEELIGVDADICE